MLAQELLDIRFALRRRGIIFAYSGYVTEAVLTGLGEALKQKLTASCRPTSPAARGASPSDISG
jgi:hypothetical protein